MALVHSRILRVFYGSSHQEGALGSKYKLHVQHGINHHYEVFRGVLKDKCDKLMSDITWKIMCDKLMSDITWKIMYVEKDIMKTSLVACKN